MARNVWTHQEVQVLQEMARDGANLRRVAERLGRSLRSVQHKARSLRMAFNAHGVWTSEEVQVLEEMARNGASRSMIADRLDRSRPSVQNKARALRIPLNVSRAWASQQVQILREMARDGSSASAASAYLNRSLAAVQQKAAALGISFNHGRPGRRHEFSFQAWRPLKDDSKRPNGNVSRAVAFAESLRQVVTDFWTKENHTVQELADHLNHLNHRTLRGRAWTFYSAWTLLARLTGRPTIRTPHKSPLSTPASDSTLPRSSADSDPA